MIFKHNSKILPFVKMAYTGSCPRSLWLNLSAISKNLCHPRTARLYEKQISGLSQRAFCRRSRR